MDKIGQRLDHLRRQYGLSYEKLAAIIGDITGDALRKAVKRNSIKEYYLRIISDKLGTSQKWLLTGEGDMYQTIRDRGSVMNVQRTAINNIYHVPAPAQKAFCEGQADPSSNSDIFGYFIPGFRSQGFSFPILGSCMEPLLYPGEIIITDREPVLSINEIEYDHTYAVAWHNKVNIRWIKRSDSPGMIIMKSENNSFHSKESHFKEVKLYKCKRVIQWKLAEM